MCALHTRLFNVKAKTSEINRQEITQPDNKLTTLQSSCELGEKCGISKCRKSLFVFMCTCEWHLKTKKEAISSCSDEWRYKLGGSVVDVRRGREILARLM